MPILFLLTGIVVSYRNSTSNHNSRRLRRFCSSLYLIEILHQTTTRCAEVDRHYRCILSKFYIKPQQGSRPESISSVVSYRNSTSNHNFSAFRELAHMVVSYRNSTSNHNTYDIDLTTKMLYLIEILHQTTTFRHFEEYQL